ncbi:hypothetical protein SEA_ZENTENO07_102 [Mycobacterium phage Zenteno07]|nr:hypothetical protein SEA_ZENTENO07_102 [Mycobacterium phage Zenteno07]
MKAKLTVHLYGRTEVTIHDNAREARGRLLDILAAQRLDREGNGNEGVLVASGVGTHMGSYTVVEVDDEAHLYWVIETARGEVPFTGTDAEVRDQARQFYVGSTIRRVTREELEEVKQGR